jgi:hypothetical protein
MCPNGCVLPGSTVVKWTFNSYRERGFIGDTCFDMNVFNVKVVATNVSDPLLTEELVKGCGEGQATFVGLEPGVYNLEVTPLDGDDASLVTAPVVAQGMAPAEGMTMTTEVNVPYEQWVNAATFMGQYLFTIKWGGVTCASATPPIVTQKLKLDRDGTLLGAVTDSGQAMDGVASAPCHVSAPNMFEFAQGLASGFATLTVTGTDDQGEDHTEVFDTFVGVGTNNPTVEYSVDLPLPDAGVDAMIDAPPVDAMVDAMIDAP